MSPVFPRIRPLILMDALDLDVNQGVLGHIPSLGRHGLKKTCAWKVPTIHRPYVKLKQGTLSSQKYRFISGKHGGGWKIPPLDDVTSHQPPLVPWSRLVDVQVALLLGKTPLVPAASSRFLRQNVPQNAGSLWSLCYTIYTNWYLIKAQYFGCLKKKSKLPYSFWE